jgi:hypothetical protein
MLSQTTPADFAALEVDDTTILPAGFPVGEASVAELQDALFGPAPPGADSNVGGVISLSGADAVQETVLTAHERKIENYTNLLARAHSAEEISQLVMWDDDFFAQAVDDVRRNGFDSEFAALSGFEMGRVDDPNRLADALASQREQFATAILNRADFAGAIATRGLNGVGVDGFEGMSHPEAAKLSSDTIDYFGDPASFEGVTRESFQAMYAAGLMDYKTHTVAFNQAETGRFDKASLIAGGLTFGVGIALNPKAAINTVKGIGQAGLSALQLSAKQLGRLKDVFTGNFKALAGRAQNRRIGYVDTSSLEAIGSLNAVRAGGSDRLPSVLYNGERTTLFHYTNEANLNSILESKTLFNSKGFTHARHGDGQYLADISPDQIVALTKRDLTQSQVQAGQMSLGQLSSLFFNKGNMGNKISHFVEIDITDLVVRQGVTTQGNQLRRGVQFILNDNNLDLTNRIVNSGRVLD